MKNEEGKKLQNGKKPNMKRNNLRPCIIRFECFTQIEFACICMNVRTYVSAYVHDLFCFHLHITHIVVNCICCRPRLRRHRYFCMEIKSSHGKPLQRPICINILEKMCVTKTKRIIIKRRRERRKAKHVGKSGWKIRCRRRKKSTSTSRGTRCWIVSAQEIAHIEESKVCSTFCIMYVTRLFLFRGIIRKEIIAHAQSKVVWKSD